MTAPLDPEAGAAILRHIGVEAALDRAEAEEQKRPPLKSDGWTFGEGE